MTAKSSGCAGIVAPEVSVVGTPQNAAPRHGAMEAGAFEIFLAWSETTLTVGPGQTALQVLQDAGVPVETGCQTGGCGMCAIDFVEGDIVHKDGCLNAADRDRMFCPCVSRAKTRVVLAL